MQYIFMEQKEGKKIETIKSNQMQLFSSKTILFIPSYFSDTMAVCPATQFCFSIA